MRVPFNLSLEGRRAIVCGSSDGIGFGCAEALLHAGAQVWLNGRREGTLRDAFKRLEAVYGNRVETVVGDAMSADGRRRLLAACPQPDILVCNAAGPKPGSYRQLDEEDWQSALASGMVAPITLMNEFAQTMVQRGWGRIIAISSTSIRAPVPELDLSTGVRSGLAGFMATLARQLAPHGVTVNAILPGLIKTRRLQGYLDALSAARSCDPEEVKAEAIRTIPAGRFGTVEEIGALCAFLASPPAGYLTGLSILADGGMVPVR